MTLSTKLGVVEISTLWHFRLPLLIQMFIKVAFSPRLSVNPGRFAHFPVRPWVVSPTFPFAPSRFAPGLFRPLSRSPLSRFAFFPVRPRVVSPPYKILFLLLIFRPQKWYKALIFLLIGDFSWQRIRDVRRKLSILCGILKSNPSIYVCQTGSWFILSILRPYIAWASVTPKKRILYSSNFKYLLFLSSPLNPWTLQILTYIWHFHVFFPEIRLLLNWN